MGDVTTNTVLDEAASRVGAEHVRPGDASDVVDGIEPRVVATPPTGERLASLLGWASGEGLSVGVRGGGTKLTWGGVYGPTDLMLSTQRLDRVLEHRHGDLTATVEAGVTLETLNSALARHGQWLPFDPPWFDRATVGGTVATNDSGPGRHAHGAPRDLIIGVTMARADGVRAKAGGIVVKNVAGYDLSRLMTGAFGTLGIVLDATFKLAPRPAASRTTIIDVPTLGDLDGVLAAVSTSSLTPSAVEIAWPPVRLLIRFESVESSVAQQAGAVEKLMASHPVTCATVESDEEIQRWTSHRARWDGSGTLVKVSVLPRAVASTLEFLEDAVRTAGVEVAAQGRAGLGVLDIWVRGPLESRVRVLTGLRERFRAGQGSAVIRKGDAEIRRIVDPWGPIGDGLPVMRAIKQRFDPDGALNAGKGPV